MSSAAPAVLIDGRRRRSLPPSDRGLAYGDGLFETVAVVEGRPRLWGLHLERLRAGAHRLGLPSPPEDLLTAEADRLCRGERGAVLKILYTAGSGGRGYGRGHVRPVRIVMRLPVPQHPIAHWRDGVRLRWCQLRLAHQPQLAGLKHLNRLEQVLARREWDDPAIAEGLLLNQNGEVVEGTVSNLFARFGERLLTPPLHECGVAGVMRRRLLELAAAEGVEVAEQALSVERLLQADEVLLCNSLIGLWPVRALEDRQWSNQDLSRRLLKRLLQEQEFLAPEGLRADV